MDPVVHFEFPYADAGRIARFYQAAFGWKTQPLGEEMGGYVLATTGDEDVQSPGAVRGVINGGFFRRGDDKPSQVPSVVIAVQDVHQAMAAVQKAGGEVLGEPMPIPGVGLYVSFYDTERNRVSMLQPNRPAGG